MRAQRRTSRGRAAAVARSRGASLLVLVMFLFGAHRAQADVFGVAHRGGRIQGPENTLDVFQLTIDLGVTPWLETDVWLSSDGVPMIHHDLDLCRTTDIDTWSGYDCTVAANNPFGHFPRVGEFTLTELKTLDVGSWFSPAFAGTRMPTLEEALQLVDGTGVPLLIEIKTGSQPAAIKEILDRTGLSWNNLIIWARQAFAFDQFHPVLPGIRQISGAFLIDDVTDELLQQRAAAGDYGISAQMSASSLDQAFVDRVHWYGLFLYGIPPAYGGTPMLTQAALGVDGIHVQNEIQWQTILATRPCMDRIDNDGDGVGDYYGIDLDFDMGRSIDVARDPGCADLFAPSELAACQDMVDNDGDGLTDMADPGCAHPNDTSEELSVPLLTPIGAALLAAALAFTALVRRARLELGGASSRC